MEKVSIIVPVYNGEAHLLRCAESILAQDYPELELILVDDGSRDASFELMRELAARDTRVKAIHKENGGVSSARNRGLDEASGRYIQFSDVDDWLPIDATKLLMREIEASDADLVIGDFYRVVGNNVSCKGSIDEGGLLNRQEYADEMLRSPADLYYGALWNKLYRRDLIERYGVRMDETISYSEDMIFNLEYLLHADKIAVLKAPVYYYEYMAVSRDSLSLPFMPGTKKLSSETGGSLLRSPFGGELETAYLEGRMLMRYLDTVAKKHDLRRDEMTVLYLLWKLDRPCRAAELSVFPGLTKSDITFALAKLLYAGLVTRETDGGTAYRFHAPELEPELRQMVGDFQAVSFEGLSEEELSVYHRCTETIRDNIRRRLLVEKTGEF